jgi:thiamine-phosphate diphosphorylase
MPDTAPDMAAVLQLPCLCLVADCSVVGPDDLLPRVARAVDGGVTLVQLRAKELSSGRMLSLATELKRAIEGRATLLVNDRVDVAAAAGAAGVQLGEEALPVSAARQILSAGSLIGRSVHSASGADRAVADGADFLLLGTMFATVSHPGATPAGPGLMRESASRCDRPLIGIGGITSENVAEVMAAGASGVAVIRSILAAVDPQQAALELSSALRISWRETQAKLNTSVRPTAGRSF